MARLIAQPLRVPRVPEEEKIREEILTEGNFSSGMISELDATDLPPKTLRRIVNARIYLDRIYGSPGLSSSLVPAKPDSNKVLKMYGFTKNDGTSHNYRFTKSSIHKLLTSSWTALTGTLTGGDLDRITAAIALDQIVFTNNGVEPIQLLNTGANSFGNLGNAPRYKYTTVFHNRVIGLNLAGPTANPIEVGHSGNLNFVEFNPATDPSAGVTPLIESPGDLSDFITGGVGFSDILAVFRQRSIWVGTKTQVARQPIYYRSDVSGIGCGLPYTITVLPNNRIIFADYIKRDVFIYTPGSRVAEPVGTLNQSLMFDSITNTDAPFGAYDAILDQYHLCIPSSTSMLVTVWIYDFKTKSWTMEEIEDLSSLDFPETAGANLKIAELTGTISQLTGKIATLGVNTDAKLPVDYYGYTNGEIRRETTNLDVNTVLESRVHTADNDEKDIDVSKLKFDFSVRNPVTIRLYYSKDDGETWKLAKTKVYPSYARDTKIKFMLTKLITASRFKWKIEINGRNWELLKHVIKHNVSGDSKPTAT